MTKLDGPKINKSKIQSPTIIFTEKAATELVLILENDFTLQGKYFRLLISGKGCDGFTYSCGFTDLHEDDFLIKIGAPDNYDLHVLIDPFAAFYMQNISVDFVLDPYLNEEGFVITNLDQKNFQGKFFNKDGASLPPME